MAKVKPITQKKNFSKRKGTRDNKAKNKVMKISKKPGRTRRGRRRILKKPEKQPSGVVYISHIPHGFYEDQIEGYFSQFGKVTAVSVPRSKSGRARGYAFIEYKYPEIAKIAAETMDNYLMLNRLLKAKYIPPEEQKPHLFHIARSARENHKTAADKAALAVKHSRKLKNRHLKLSLEAKCATKLLKKKVSLMKRVEKLGLSQDFLVEEANVQSIIERKKEMEANKKNKSSKHDLKPEKGEETDTSEEQLSSSDSEDIQSLEDIDFSSEDSEEVESMSDEEKDSKNHTSSQARRVAKYLSKKIKPKPTKLRKPIKDQSASNAPVKLSSQKQNKRKLILSQKGVMSENETMSLSNNSQPKFVAKSKRNNTSLEVKSPKKGAIKDDLKQNLNITLKRSKARTSLDKNVVTSFTEKSPLSVKRIKASPKTPTNKKSKISQVVMEVDEKDKENNSKNPPNVDKRVIRTTKTSDKKTSKGKSRDDLSLSSKKKDSSKKIPQKGVKPRNQRRP